MDYYRILQGAQGTMGCVSWANIKTEFIPSVDKTFFINFEKLEEAIEPIYRIQKRRIGMECLLLNKTNLLKILSEKFDGDPKKLSQKLSNWTLILVLSGFKRRPLERIQYQEKALKDIASDLLLKVWETIPDGGGLEKEIPRLLRKPWQGDSYWKSSENLQYKDLFFIATLNKIKSFYQSFAETAIGFDYPLGDAGMYIQPLEQGRGCHFEFNLYYDKKERSEDSMKEMVSALSYDFMNMGALFTRPYGELPKLVYKRAYGYTKVLKQIKGIMDPNNIMCPGALCF
jgi:hypothetical protein